MPNKVIITSPDGTMEWSGESDFVPPIGTSVTCRGGRGRDIQFNGVVAEIHTDVFFGFGVNEGNSMGGMVISVWLDPLEEKTEC